MLAFLSWTPALPPVLAWLCVGALTAAFAYAWRRLTARFGRRRAWPVLAARGLLFLLLVMALLDPSVQRRRASHEARRLLALLDDSVSMRIADGPVSRRQRADDLLDRLRGRLPAHATLEIIPFDCRLLPGRRSASAVWPEEPPGTDLGAALEEAAGRAAAVDAAAVLLLSDGGDEAVRVAKLPDAPLVAVGIGGDGAGRPNVAIVRAQMPESVEKEVLFDVGAELAAQGSAEFLRRLESVGVTLLRRQGETWETLATRDVRLSGGRATVAFQVRCDEPGPALFRLQAALTPGEISPLDNRRTLQVDVRREALDVLYYSLRLGADLKMLRQELGTDPSLTFTALYRTLGERLSAQGPDAAAQEELIRGFPTNLARLKRFDCIVAGSFPAHEWTADACRALLAFVEQGGGLVWLGGEESFDGGGYGSSPLAPLLPWDLSGGESSLQRGAFGVSIPASSAAQPAVAGLRELLAGAGEDPAARPPGVSAVNLPGALRPGVDVLMEAELPGRRAPLVTLHRYGRGRVLTVASNTTWQWAREPGTAAQLYRRFWRQAVRAVCGQSEGGRVLQVTWNAASFRPGDPVAATVRLAETADVQLKAALQGPDGTLPLRPTAGREGDVWQVEWVLRSRESWTLQLTAERAGETLETYRRKIPVALLPDEGSRLACHSNELARVAGLGGGWHLPEARADELPARLGELLRPVERVETRSLVSGRPWFLLSVLAAALAEWIFRRRLNLV